MGAVTAPGKYHIERNSSMLRFLAEVGGFTPFAATKRIQIRRVDSKTGKSMVIEYNFRAIEQGSVGAKSGVLRNNDVIIVPERRLFE